MSTAAIFTEGYRVGSASVKLIFTEGFEFGEAISELRPFSLSSRALGYTATSRQLGYTATSRRLS